MPPAYIFTTPFISNEKRRADMRCTGMPERAASMLVCMSLVFASVATMSRSSPVSSGKSCLSMPYCLAWSRAWSLSHAMDAARSAAQVMSAAPLSRMSLLHPSLYAMPTAPGKANTSLP